MQNFLTLAASSGKVLVSTQWLPLIYEGEPTPLPALPFEVSFYPSKEGWLREFEKIKESKKGDFHFFFGFGPFFKTFLLKR